MLQKDSVNTLIFPCRGLNKCPARHSINGQRPVGEVPTGQQGSGVIMRTVPPRTINRLLRCLGQELSVKVKVKGH